MDRFEAYARFDHPSRNPVSFQALLAAPAAPLTPQQQATLDRISSDTAALMILVSELLAEGDHQLR